MIRIAIAEDDMQSAQKLCMYIDSFAKESGKSIEATVYSNGEELVENYRAQFDLLLLDVEMPFLDGMSTAKIIRKTDPEVVIIFITNMAQYAIQGYAVDALDYVLKPVSYFAFSQRLSRAISRMKREKPQFLTVQVRGSTVKLERSELLYIESQGHRLIFHTQNEQLQSQGAMKEWEAQLAPMGFFRCNKGYLVNLEHVDGVRDGCAVVGGDMLLISRSRKAAFLEALAAYVGGGGR